jgi:hypothetical protein
LKPLASEKAARDFQSRSLLLIKAARHCQSRYSFRRMRPLASVKAAPHCQSRSPLSKPLRLELKRIFLVLPRAQWTLVKAAYPC